MKLSDYIVDYLLKQGVTDYFGYQGTMIAHFIDSIGKNGKVRNHICYNEQGAAFEAVGYMKSSNKVACAYSTSGPGATNLITGIADAYYDSVPVIFITGQLNTYEYSSVKTLRQQGFQETNIVDIVKPITKYAVQVRNANDIAYELEKALFLANNKRPGPVLIDIPMDIQRAIIDVDQLTHFEVKNEDDIKYDSIAKDILDAIENSERPILILGNGINNYSCLNEVIGKIKIPVLYSMIAKSLIPHDNPYNFGFIGTAYGQRYSNLIACKKADLVISLGCRLNGRTIGLNRQKFNPDAKIIRVEIDQEELKLSIHSDDINYNCDVNILLNTINDMLNRINITKKESWLDVCNIIKNKLKNIDSDIPTSLPNKYIEILNDYTTNTTNVFVDVGQNQVWAAHSIKIKEGQKIIFSGGHGAMGIALPAAIGGTIANKNKSFVISGDGGFQMNIQELQLLKTENLPITIFVFNNNSLGLIHQQQCDFFENKFYGACKEGGYSAPSFKAIGEAYGINSYEVHSLDEMKEVLNTYDSSIPNLIEIKLEVGTKAYPKTHFGKEMINQKPELDEELLNYLLSI